MVDTRHDLQIRTTVKDLASRELRSLGGTGKKAGASIAAGFVKAQLAIGVFKTAVRGAFRLFKSVTTGAIKQMDELGKRSQKIGVSTKFFSEMAHAAALSGTSMETLARGIRNVSRNLRAATISPQIADAFTEIGIGTREVQQLLEGPVEDAFLRIAEGLGKVDSEAKRVALSMKTFGMLAGPELLPMIRQGIRGIREMREEARSLGLSISEGDFALAAAANDAITRFQGSVEGIKRTLALEFMPQLTSALNAVASFVAQNRDRIITMVTGAVRTVGTMIVNALQGVSIGIASLIDSIETFSIKKSVGSRFGQAFGEVGEFFGLVPEGASKAVMGAVRDGMGPREQAVRAAWERISTYFEDAGQEWARAQGRQALQNVGKILSDVWVEDVAKPLRDAARRLFGGDGDDEILISGGSRSWINKFLHGEIVRDEGGTKVGMSGGIDAALARMRASLTPEALGMSVVQSAAQAWTGFFDAITFGSARAGDAFRQMASSMLRQLANLANQQLFVELLGALGLGATASAGAPGGGAAPTARGGSTAPTQGIR